MTDRELMQQAHDALLNFEGDISDAMFAVLTTLRARLAQPEPPWINNTQTGNFFNVSQPEPEPVAWYYAGSDVEWHSVVLDADLDDAQKANCTPLYTAPPQRKWQGLTDEEISELIRTTHNTGSFVRAIEAKLKEKNT